MDTTAPSPPITVYWRPGCPYCVMLRHGLRRAGVPSHDVNIWDDPDAAAAVRAAATGNETVPTVVVGGTTLVNPTVAAVRDAMRAEGIGAPDAPPRAARLSGSGALRRLFGRSRTP